MSSDPLWFWNESLRWLRFNCYLLKRFRGIQRHFVEIWFEIILFSWILSRWCWWYWLFDQWCCWFWSLLLSELHQISTCSLCWTEIINILHWFLSLKALVLLFLVGRFRLLCERIFSNWEVFSFRLLFLIVK